MITVSPEMLALFELIKKAARAEATVLIRGESGTGKEMVARALHHLSRRSEGPFQAMNCATLTAEMLASELFGHVKGAFTGAVRDRPGLLRMAHKGTLFMDEVAEMPLDLQARLLRVLQERTFIPLGGTDPVEVDVRFLSATHVALRDAVEKKHFRPDLMYRIRVIPLYLPRLAEREGDVEALLWHYIDLFNARGNRQIEGIADDAFEAMTEYDWPGNIRELRNVMEYAYALGEGETFVWDDMTPELRGEGPVVPRVLADPVDSEAARIREALRSTRGKKGAAADALGMSRSTLWRKMREHHIRS
jgi:two-component system response regulator AtoC